MCTHHIFLSVLMEFLLIAIELCKRKECQFFYKHHFVIRLATSWSLMQLWSTCIMQHWHQKEHLPMCWSKSFPLLLGHLQTINKILWWKFIKKQWLFRKYYQREQDFEIFWLVCPIFQWNYVPLFSFAKVRISIYIMAPKIMNQ